MAGTGHAGTGAAAPAALGRRMRTALRCGRHQGLPGVCVLADPAGAYRLQPPYPTIAIFEGEDRAALRAIAKTGVPAITAGLSEHDTVTYSSMAQDCCAVTVGRPFLTLRGTSVQEQEIVLPCPCAGTPLLLFVTAALVLGVAPSCFPACFPSPRTPAKRACPSRPGACTAKGKTGAPAAAPKPRRRSPAKHRARSRCAR